MALRKCTREIYKGNIWREPHNITAQQKAPPRTSGSSTDDLCLKDGSARDTNGTRSTRHQTALEAAIHHYKTDRRRERLRPKDEDRKINRHLDRKRETRDIRKIDRQTHTKRKERNIKIQIEK